MLNTKFVFVASILLSIITFVGAEYVDEYYQEEQRNSQQIYYEQQSMNFYSPYTSQGYDSGHFYQEPPMNHPGSEDYELKVYGRAGYRN